MGRGERAIGRCRDIEKERQRYRVRDSERDREREKVSDRKKRHRNMFNWIYKKRQKSDRFKSIKRDREYATEKEKE